MSCSCRVRSTWRMVVSSSAATWAARPFPGPGKAREEAPDSGACGAPGWSGDGQKRWRSAARSRRWHATEGRTLEQIARQHHTTRDTCRSARGGIVRVSGAVVETVAVKPARRPPPHLAVVWQECGRRGPPKSTGTRYNDPRDFMVHSPQWGYGGSRSSARRCAPRGKNVDEQGSDRVHMQASARNKEFS